MGKEKSLINHLKSPRLQLHAIAMSILPRTKAHSAGHVEGKDFNGHGNEPHKHNSVRRRQNHTTTSLIAPARAGGWVHPAALSFVKVTSKRGQRIDLISRQSLCVQLAKLTLDGEEGGKEDLARRGKKIRTSLPKGEIIIRILPQLLTYTLTRT